MKGFMQAPLVASLMMILVTQSASAEALDKAIRDILKEEAAETSLKKGEVVEDLTAEPSIVPNTNLDFNALEGKISSQIKQALSTDTNAAQPSDEEQKDLELALENVVSSALLQGNKLDDIRNAVNAAMSDLKNIAPEGEEIPAEKIQSAAVALKEIVSENPTAVDGSGEDSYINSLKAELKEAPKTVQEVTIAKEAPQTESVVALDKAVEESVTLPETKTTSAVDKILAAMPESQRSSQAIVAPEVKPSVENAIEESSVAVVTSESTKAEVTEASIKQENPVVRTTSQSQVPGSSQNNSVEIRTAEAIIETVTVLKGESLYKLAKRVYGTGSKYLALYEANKDTISDPNLIIVGQVLKVPR